MMKMSSVWNTAENLLLGPRMDSARGRGGHLSDVTHTVEDAEEGEEVLPVTNPSMTTATANPTATTVNLPGRSSPTITPPGSGRGLSDKSRGRGSSLPPAIAERLARHKAQEQLVYKRKLKHLKQIVNELVFENAALCDQVAEVQQQVVVAAEERTFLLKRLCQYQTTTDQHNQLNTKSNSYFILGSGSVDNWDSKKPKLASLKRKLSDPSQGSPSATTSPSGSSERTIVSEREAYHREQCIFPVGFCSSRIFASLRDPLKPVLYTCKILDGGLIPRFEVVCEDEEDAVVVGNSPAECHNHILQTINLALDMDLLTIRPEGSNSEERGCRFFGLTHPSVQNVLQACPGARKCSRYKWVKFEVCRSEAEVECVFEAEKEASLCHEALLRNIRFARHHVTSP
ncbi:Transforming growth factor beta regulator 1-like [Homarus americanus]|uniref:Transforming growth factor beta regulator 1-like n=1 Tax=Homarus americanus TaxID=6706 RepID=A0A8J5MR69_HOMAM|nr:Transforming growth factor beta regulator 1-like [Homarus americanus]